MNKKPKTQRQLQVGESIKRIVADIFLKKGLSSISGNYITILQADISADMKNCKIFIDIFGDNSKNNEILEKLNLMSKNIRFELSKKLTMRNSPEIIFILDKTSQNSIDIKNLIDSEAKNF